MLLLNTLKNKLYPVISRYLANATLVNGILKGADKPFRCLFVENSNMMDYVCTQAYASYPRILKKWKAWIPDLHKTIINNSSSFDLCIAVLPKNIGSVLSRVCDFTGDEWVRQYIDTSGKFEEIKKHFHKTKIQVSNQVRHKYGMSYRVSNDLNDFELFYYRMYVPHTKIKFDNQAYIASYEVMKGYFKKGFLLLITTESQDIAGALCVKNDDVLFFRDQGVLDGSEVYVKRGAQYAIYYFTIHYAWENGFKTLDTMKSRSCLNDGVYKTKRDWGATVYADDESDASVYYMIPRFSETISAYFNNNPAIINEEDGLYGLAGWQGAYDIAMLDKNELSKRYFSPGLKGMILLSPTGGKMKMSFDEVSTQGLI
jgi:hypothetical protein